MPKRGERTIYNRYLRWQKAELRLDIAKNAAFGEDIRIRSEKNFNRADYTRLQKKAERDAKKQLNGRLKKSK